MKSETVIIKHHEISKYMQLKAKGFKTAWVGNGLICMTKSTPCNP